jgi:hypothetical protein
MLTVVWSGITVDCIELGGRSLEQRYDYDGCVVMVMADPEGNEFCLVQHFRRLHAPSAIERRTTDRDE